ncbi:hypothetical protein TRFO_26471 [Tritrichomonas foetus]|uniref:Uncharacterized protein n=1 Tax=Tritrichomonas foetus TaxID=1144522 RepID=A0A1J4K7P2_9EUKA|nr:hypothetical protein TRFO_26471 [Tritrichomonas foetus]|eukprot:OHT05732.1 hypothetical protein TRFO_26471 [Tritrichomonas foetus]
MEEKQVYLGFDKQDWWMLIGDVIFFYFMLFWPAMKTLVVVRNPKHFIGRWSTYWIGLPSFLLIFYVIRFFLKRWFVFPIIEIFIGIICSYNHGSVIQRFAVNVISKIFKRNYQFLKKLPNTALANVMQLIQTPINFLVKFAFSQQNSNNGQPKIIRSDDEDDD